MGKWGRVLSFAFVCLLPWSAYGKPAVMWRTAYYGGWWLKSLDPSVLKPDQIDYSALTHLIFFGLSVNSDASVNESASGAGSAGAEELIRRAHAAGKKVLLCVYGASTNPDYNDALRGATIPARIEKLLNRLESIVVRDGYDGLDIDWEPVVPDDAPFYSRLADGLRGRLDRLGRRKRRHYDLTAAVADVPQMFAALQEDFDQINLMTYDLSGLWLNETWYNSPLYNPPPTNGDDPLPSIDGMVRQYEDAGVVAEKLGVGLEAYGYLWSYQNIWKKIKYCLFTLPLPPLDGPGRPWLVPPAINDSVPYSAIMRAYYSPDRYHWDNDAQVPYLAQGESPDRSPYFLSYDDERSCKAKLEYARERHLGGLMMWELGGQWMPEKPVPDPLLQSIRD